MTVNLRHLHAYAEVARLRSISAAARAVHLSQPAVTQAITGVEKHFRATLLKRSSNGVELTELGQLCLARIERALAHLREGVAEITRTPSRSDVVRSVAVAQLDALTAVVQHRTFSAAARARGMSQPAVHRAARELERALGVALFEKTSFGVVPTREAERLSRRAKLAFAELAQARAELTALAGGETGTTVIGAMPLARTYLIPSALIDFTAQVPTHRVRILDGTYENLLGGLQSGEVDFLVGAMRDPAMLTDVVQEHLFDDPLSIVVRAGHPLAARKRISMPSLLRYPWIAPRSGSPLRTHFNALFSAAGATQPDACIECNSLAASRALLLQSDRVMLLSAHQIYYELRARLLVALPHPAGRVVRPIGLTYREGWQPTASQEKLLQLLREHARSDTVALSAPLR